MAVTPTTFNVAMGAVLTAHLRNVRLGEPVEQAYDGTRILSQLEMDRDRTIDGGGYIHTQISATQDRLGGAYEGADAINEDVSDEDTMAITALTFYSEPIKVYRSDVIKAGGTAGAEERLFRYVENKRKQAMRRIRIGLEKDMTLAATAAKSVESFVATISATPTTGVVQGIDRATETYWRNQTQHVGSLAANFDALEELSADCTKGGESDWDYAFCDKKSWLSLKKHARTFLSLNAGTAESAYGKRLADAGIPVIEFEGKPITWSPRISSTTDWSGETPVGSASGGAIYFMKKSALQLCPVPDEEFQIEGPFPLEARDTPEHGMKWHVMWSGQNVWEEPSATGVGYDILP